MLLGFPIIFLLPKPCSLARNPLLAESSVSSIAYRIIHLFAEIVWISDSDIEASRYLARASRIMGRNAKDSLGQALIKQHHSHNAQHKRGGADIQPALESVIDARDLDTVVEQAELAGRIFSSVNPLPEVLVADESAEDDMLSAEEKNQQRKLEEALHQSSLKIPRRPKWHAGMTPEELDVNERQSFLKWRREFASLEENEKLVITPFEKNLEIWRQLWRVIERSDLIVMVVDARNPLFYRCPDLEAYVKEVDPYKRTMLLVNKADLLPSSARLRWAEYFRSQGISFLFWSAKIATAVLEGNIIKNEDLKVADSCSGSLPCEYTQILGREELLDRLQAEAEQVSYLRREASKVSNLEERCTHLQRDEDNGKSVANGFQSGPSREISRHVVVGFVGYPNVGKSSTINALVGEKRTGVTSTPGKTKHFQTLILSEKLILCDCPGLVFPSFTTSRSDMVASGVLPIDRLTDHRGPVQVVADLVPRNTLEKQYGISLPKPKPYEFHGRPPTAHELLKTFCQSRGYVASAGLADETRAARQILKDYVNGKLLYYHLPPSDNEVDSVSDGVDIDTSLNEDESDKTLKCEGVMEHLDSFETMAGLEVSTSTNRGKNIVKDLSTHKMHRKAPRKKNRSWRVGNDESDGMPLVRGVSKPVSHGAAQLAQIN